MNTLESHNMISPFGEEEECARFIVDTVDVPFVLHNITNLSQSYTFSFWIKAERACTLTTCSKVCNVTTKWQRYIITYTASGKNLNVRFNNTGTYYMYRPKLELGSKATDWTEAPEDVGNELEEVRQIITENSTSIINDCERIVLSALETYTEQGEFDTYKESTDAQLKLISDQMELKFTETIQQLENVNGTLQEQINTITKYFTFDINGLTIGQIDNPYKVIIDNDRYSMTVNGTEVMWIADGKVFTPEIEVTMAFKLFNYLIDQDEDGRVNCTYVGGNA